MVHLLSGTHCVHSPRNLAQGLIGVAEDGAVEESIRHVYELVVQGINLSSQPMIRNHIRALIGWVGGFLRLGYYGFS